MIKCSFLAVIARTADEFSVEANPKYIRDVMKDSRPVTTPSAKRTPTTQSLVELANEKRAVCRTAEVPRSVLISCTA